MNYNVLKSHEKGYPIIKNGKLTYVVLMCVRNEEKIIEEGINTILAQSVKPKAIVVVNDGSTDKTGEILKNKFSGNRILTVFNREDRGYSALGTVEMADVYNAGLRYLYNLGWDYLLICSADTMLPENYVEEIIKRMGTEYGVAGGKTNGVPRQNRGTCTGSGRVIKREIMDGLDGALPRLYSWEEAPMMYAFMIGLKVGHFPEVYFHQTRKGGEGHKRNYVGWGRGMKHGGYTYSRAFFRSFKWIIRDRKPIAGLQLLYGFLTIRRPKGYDYIDYWLENATKPIHRIICYKIKRRIF